MLSFLRDQDADKTPAQRPDASTRGTDSEVFGQAQSRRHSQWVKETAAQTEEYFTIAAQNKNVRKSTMLIGVLFGIGLLCLGFMIKKSAPKTASASPDGTDEAQIELAIARLTGVSSEMFSRMDQIVKKFYEFSDVLQVKVNELVKNPFELEMFLSNLMKKMDVQEQTVDVDPELIIQQQLRQKAKKLQLASIMQSDQGTCCMINNKILYVEDSIDGFGVIQIGDTFVKLKWIGQEDSESLSSDGLEIVLKLSE